MKNTWRVEILDITDHPTAARMLELQGAAYAVEAELIGFEAIPGREEALEDVIATATRLNWSGIRSSGTIIAAMATSTPAGGICDIDRLVVDPSWFRRGLARALISSLPLDLTTTVSTGTANHPGIALYESMGFIAESEQVIAPGVTITQLRRAG